MKRVCEPELMDDDAQARAYSEADFETPHAAFVDTLMAKIDGADGVRILDLGCGPADVLARTAQALPAATFVGVDGAEAMLKYAAARLAEQGLADRVTLVESVLPGAKLEGTFHGVMSNSLLHHLHDPAVLWSEVKAQVHPGGFVFVMDLMRPADDATVERFVELYADGEPEVLRRDFYHSLKAAFTLDEVRAQLVDAGLSGLSVEATSDRHLIIFGRVAE